MNQRTSKTMRVLTFQLFVIGCVLCLLGRAQALEVTLSWEAVDAADYYVVYWGPSPGHYTDDSGAVWQTSYILSDPKLPDRRYYFAVRAFNSYSGSGFSDEICTLGPQDFRPPYDQYNRGWAVTSGYLKGFKILYHDSEPFAPTLGVSGQIPSVHLNDLKPVGIPLDLEPGDQVFNRPVTIFVPCPGYSEVEDFSVCLYGEGRGWVLAWDGSSGDLQEAAEGWLAGEPIHHKYNPSVGAATVEIKLHHFSGVQVAAPADARAVASTSSESSSMDGGAVGGGCFISAMGGNESRQ